MDAFDVNGLIAGVGILWKSLENTWLFCRLNDKYQWKPGSKGAGMSWEGRLLALFDDLEQQAAGLEFATREANVAELAVAQYADIEFSERLHASVGNRVQLRVAGGQILVGDLSRVGFDWVLLQGLPEEWVVPTGMITAAVGLSKHSDPVAGAAPLGKLKLTSVLRGLASSREECVLFWADQQQLTGTLGRVGRDFVEVQAGDQGRIHVVPLHLVSSLRGRA